MVAALTPAQEEVLAVLRAREQPRPAVDPGLRAELRSRLESRLAPLAAGLDQPVFVSKSALAQVHACEAHHLAEHAAPFGWSLPTARGTVAHKAIEISVHRRGAVSPLELVDEAFACLEDEPDASIASFLLGLAESERAELRSEVNDLVSKFAELWPPLRRRWAPRTESRVRAELCGGMVVLLGKVDLALGTASGTTAGTLVVDLKTGATHAGHLDDLRFYAGDAASRGSSLPPRRLQPRRRNLPGRGRQRGRPRVRRPAHGGWDRQDHRAPARPADAFGHPQPRLPVVPAPPPLSQRRGLGAPPGRHRYSSPVRRRSATDLRWGPGRGQPS